MNLLFLDIETSPAEVLVWDLFKPHIGPDQVIRPTSVLCFAARWYGKPGTIFRRSLRQRGAEFNDMIRAAHQLLSEADAVCHYNGLFFDIPRLNAEFLRLGLKPPDRTLNPPTPLRPI